MRLSTTLRSVSLGGSILVAEGLALAQEQTSTTIEVPAGFEPVPGGKPKADAANASMLVMGAYAAFAIGFIAYLIYLGRLQSQLFGEVEKLSERMARAERT